MDKEASPLKEHYSALIYIMNHLPADRAKFVKCVLIISGLLGLGLTIWEIIYTKSSSANSYFLIGSFCCLVLWFLMELMSGRAEEKGALSRDLSEDEEAVCSVIENFQGSADRKKILEEVKPWFQDKYKKNNHIDGKIRKILRTLEGENILKKNGNIYSL